MRQSDWVLLALSVSDEAAVQPVQLQKALFLVAEQGKPGRDFYKFEPYDYGPYSKEVRDDVDTLVSSGLVEVVLKPGVRWRKYILTEKGRMRAKEVEKKAPQGAVQYLTSVVKWTQSLTFPALVSAIYTHFPDYKVNSVFNE